MKQLIIALHWPHDKCAIGWEIFYPDEEYPDHEVIISLIIVTLKIIVSEKILFNNYVIKKN